MEEKIVLCNLNSFHDSLRLQVRYQIPIFIQQLVSRDLLTRRTPDNMILGFRHANPTNASARIGPNNPAAFDFSVNGLLSENNFAKPVFADQIFPPKKLPLEQMPVSLSP